FELSGLDLRQVEHLVDEAKEVSPSAVHALQWLLRLFRAEARGVFDHHLGQADDGVERRAQLVAHAGYELRLVLARQLQLAALLLDFVEQPHVLDRDHRLVGEGGGELDLAVVEWFYRAALQHDRADRDSLAQQRNTEHCASADFSYDVPQNVFRVVQNIGNMYDIAFDSGPSGDRAPARYKLEVCHVVTKIRCKTEAVACCVLIARPSQP